ncbi:MAG: DUF456 domain-containing protein [Alistipes sp.]|nr:DUF456 domain-containing protein [Alistipes sp.]
MNTALIIIAIASGIVGLIGAVVPIIPGTLISYAGLLVVSFTEGSDIGVAKLVVWGVISVVVIVLDYILPAFLSKRFGGTKWGSWGATIGTLLGLLFGPVGIILGPFVGAVVGEMLHEQLEFREALKVGFGSMLSFLVGTLFKLIVGFVLIYYIISDIL